ncbi:MAG: hypothetical protein R3263_11815, partial [Myxococcota bacterium]|nr:hypothetical protein [Myxococcota bacterium]
MRARRSLPPRRPGRRPRPRPSALLSALAFVLALPLAPALPAALGAEPPPSAAPAEDALPADRGRTGRDIYQCVLDNRFDSYVQTSRLLSGDRGG